MLYEFKSRATGTVTMTQSNAEWILGVIGKQPGPTGIVTVEQMPAAIEALRKAVEDEKRELREARRATRSQADETDADDDDPTEQMVSRGARAFPFIEMLQQAHKADRDVTWGV